MIVINHLQSYGQQWRQHSHCISASTAEDDLLSRIQQLEAMQVTNYSFKLLQESLESLEAQVQQQSDYDGTINLSLVQNNIHQDLDRLRNVELYDGCFQEIRTCTISTTPITTFRACSTDTVNIVSLIHYIIAHA